MNCFATPEGERLLYVPSLELTLAEVLRLNQIPSHSCSIYVRRGSELRLHIGLHEPLKNYPESRYDLLVRPDRNISYSVLIERPLEVERRADASAEYTFASVGTPERKHVEMTAADCRDFSAREVAQFVERFAAELKPKRQNCPRRERWR